MSDNRPNWDNWAMEIARAVARRGDCTRRQVGAIILDSRRRIVSWGYNGTAPGRLGCLEGGCPRGHWGTDVVAHGAPYDVPGKAFCIATHAEMNALIDADPTRLIEATLYCTTQVCDPCLKIISNSAIARVVYPHTRVGEVKVIVV